jgi:hypothetical protein
MSVADTLALALQRTCENESKCYDQSPHRTKSIMWTLAFSPQLTEQWHCWMWLWFACAQQRAARHVWLLPSCFLAADVFRHYATSRLDVFAVVIRIFFLARTSHTFFWVNSTALPSPKSVLVCTAFAPRLWSICGQQGLRNVCVLHIWCHYVYRHWRQSMARRKCVHDESSFRSL